MNCKRAMRRITCVYSTGQLAEKGARVITAANGVFVYDSDGEKIMDAMAGLWCVNIGYGREELADVAHRQMKQLPYYNTFFQTTHIPPLNCLNAFKPCARVEPRILCRFWVEANDTNIRMVRHYWTMKGKPPKINHHQPQKCLSRLDR